MVPQVPGLAPATQDQLRGLLQSISFYQEVGETIYTKRNITPHIIIDPVINEPLIPQIPDGVILFVSMDLQPLNTPDTNTGRAVTYQAGGEYGKMGK